MTVYVDNAGIPATVGARSSRWSHLTADDREELHVFAERLGLRRAWFQTCKRSCARPGEPCVHWHYDVTAPKRAAAIAAGAEPIDIRDLGAIISARRAEMRAAKEATR